MLDFIKCFHLLWLLYYFALYSMCWITWFEFWDKNSNQPDIFIFEINLNWLWPLLFLHNTGLDVLVLRLGFLQVLEKNFSNIFLFCKILARLLSQCYAGLIKLAPLSYYLEKCVQDWWYFLLKYMEELTSEAVWAYRRLLHLVDCFLIGDLTFWIVIDSSGFLLILVSV